MEHTEHNATEGGIGMPGGSPGDHAARVIELARKARLAQRTALEFMRRWAVEQAVESVGLVALRSGAIDLPARPRVDEEVRSHSDTE